ARKDGTALPVYKVAFKLAVGNREATGIEVQRAAKLTNRRITGKGAANNIKYTTLDMNGSTPGMKCAAAIQKIGGQVLKKGGRGNVDRRADKAPAQRCI